MVPIISCHYPEGNIGKANWITKLDSINVSIPHAYEENRNLQYEEGLFL
jgi:hypothetical protein